MNCEATVKGIPLYCYGELPAETEERLEEHLHACAACRGELERFRAFAAGLDAAEVRAPASLLMECRHDLMRAVYREEAPAKGRRWRLDRWGWMWGSGIRLGQPAGALATMALCAAGGFFAARYLPQTGFTGTLAGVAAEGVVSNVRSVAPDSSGRVQIAVDEIRRRNIFGRLDDPGIQRLLLAGTRDEDPGVRVEAVDLLKEQSGRREVRDALLRALTSDPNPGVRLKALEGLRSQPADEEIRRTLAEVLLNDDNPGVRIQAIDFLTARKDPSTVGVLQNVIRKENNRYVQMRCQNALQEMNASVGTF